jgi:hypothetical protein
VPFDYGFFQYQLARLVGHRGWLGVRLDRGVDRDELAGIVEDAFCTIAPKSLLAQAGLLEAED